jgi:hypothetical protein
MARALAREWGDPALERGGIRPGIDDVIDDAIDDANDGVIGGGVR